MIDYEGIYKKYNNQKGQKYPCSNQAVVYGFISTRLKWEQFLDYNRYRIRVRNKDRCIFINGETWVYLSINNSEYCCRGYRFYKIMIDVNISEKTLYETILPGCDIYCSSLEWI